MQPSAPALLTAWAPPPPPRLSVQLVFSESGNACCLPSGGGLWVSGSLLQTNEELMFATCKKGQVNVFIQTTCSKDPCFCLRSWSRGPRPVPDAGNLASALWSALPRLVVTGAQRKR